MFFTFFLFVSHFFSVYSFLRGYSLSITSSNDDLDLFLRFQEKFSKKYSDLEEFQKRFQIFSENVHMIQLHNADPLHNFTMDVNSFADLTSSEFKTKFTGGYHRLNLGSGCKSFTGTTGSVSDSYDWRNYNAVTGVKDQGQCGSCWSFSATGSMEGAWAISKGSLVTLSEQQLVDCSKRYGNLGCNGGFMDNAFQYAIDNGMCSEASYPYVSGTTEASGMCVRCDPVVRISGCMDVEPSNQLVLKQAVSKGPVSIAIEADTKYFQFYSTGILTSSSCGTNLDHGVLIVGYGSENGIPYWLVKNSWGTSWGEQGYVKIQRSDSTNDPGICGVAMEPSFAVV